MAKSLKELKKKLGEDVTKLAEEQYTIERNLFLLKQIRQNLHLSQADVAKKLHISQPAVSAIENRGENLTLISLIKYIQSIGGALDINISLPNGEMINHHF
ncbi:helix-turn-helix transcriptional regulator [Orbaceae bacterium ac157xtp]